MKVKTFFALIAAKNQKTIEGIRDQYNLIVSQPEGSYILREGSKDEVIKYLKSKEIVLNEEQYRRIRALALLQLSSNEVALAKDASKDDQNSQDEKMALFLSNVLKGS